MENPSQKSQVSSRSHTCLICGNSPDNFADGVSFHRFPKNKADEWLQLFGLTSKSIKCKLEHARLCSRHFVPTDFIDHENSRKRVVRKESIPTIRHVNEVGNFRKRLRLSIDPDEILQEDDDQQKQRNIQENSINKKTSQTTEPKQKQAKTCILCRRQCKLNSSFFSFPKDNLRREEWLEACNINYSIPANAYLCSRHFEHRHFLQPPNSVTRRALLRKNAVPTLFFVENKGNESLSNEFHNEKVGGMIPRDQQIPNASENPRSCSESPCDDLKVSQLEISNDDSRSDQIRFVSVCKDGAHTSVNIDDSEVKDLNSGRPSTPITSHSIVPRTLKSEHTDAVPTDHSYSVTKTRTSATHPRYPGDICSPQVKSSKSDKNSWNLMKTTIDNQRKKIHHLQRQVRRKQIKIMELQDALEASRNKNLLETDTAEQI